MLIGSNCAFALALTIVVLTVSCLSLRSFIGAVELFPADAITVLDTIIEFLPAWLFYILKGFCNGFESCRKLLLIFFFYSSIDFAAANSLCRLLCFPDSNT